MKAQGSARGQKRRLRANLLLTLDPEAIARGRAAAEEKGYESLSRYVEALIQGDARSRQKSPTAYALLPIVRVAHAAIAALYALRQSPPQRLIDDRLIVALEEIRDSCRQLIAAELPAYCADIDRYFTRKQDDRWGDG